MLQLCMVSIYVFVALLSCDIENGRCEENCFINVLVKRLVGEGEFLSCFCPPNETLTDNRVCLCK